MVLSTRRNHSIISHSGFTLIEAIFAIAMLLLLVVGSVSANKVATSGIKINQYRSQANLLATEAMEALMSVRVENFTGLTIGVFHPIFNGASWSLVSGSEVLGDFTRSITLTPVMRALSCFGGICDITTQGGITDTSTLSVEVKVSWAESGRSQNIVLNSIITYWR